MPHRRGRRVLSALLITIVAVLALGGCLASCGSQVTVSGKVFGELIAARQVGKSVPIPLRATITCNSTSTTSNDKGEYSFSVPKASFYTCKATAPKYSTVTANLFGEVSKFSLTFGPKLVDYCDHGASAGVLTCGVLPPATATLRGMVSDAANDQALKYVDVQCWNSARDVLSDKPVLYTTTTNDLGNYVLRNLPAGPYNCVADTDQTVQMTTLAPGATVTMDLSACERDCSPFRYHTGEVIQHMRAYLIFWLPNGRTFEPNGSSSRYEHLMEQYFQDVGGTPFYSILTQYYDTLRGPIHNEETLGGSYVDTQPYPQAGTVSHPLMDSDIVNEIDRVLDLKKGAWIADANHVVFLFTAYGVQECTGSTTDDGCTFRHNIENDFCAYHSTSFYAPQRPLDNLIYAYIPDIEDCQGLPSVASPNHDVTADSIISIVSHEQFEAASDPTMQGWYDGTTYDGEMADKCVDVFGALGGDGGNVTLAHGHRYVVQEEWSLHDQTCVLSYAPVSSA